MPVKEDAIFAVNLEKLRRIMIEMGLPEPLVDLLMSNEDDLELLCDAALSAFAASKMAITVH